MSVLMPTYQGQEFLRCALESICKFSVGDTEVILIDDGSTDQTVTLAQTYVNRLQMRVLQPTPRRNWIAMTNIGLSEATGRWCCILHQDDAWLPDRAVSLLPRLGADTVSMICFQTPIIDERDLNVGMWRFPRAVRQYVGTPTRSPLAASLYVQNWLAVPSVVFDTALARSAGGFDEDLWYTADWDMWLKLLRRAPAILSEGQVAAFRIHSHSQTVLRSGNPSVFRGQLETVQQRHRWAPDTCPRPPLYRKAGVLSTATNSAMAAAFHFRRSGYISWLRALTSAGFRGARVYAANSAIVDRLIPRVKIQLKSVFRSLRRYRGSPPIHDDWPVSASRH